MDNRIPEVQMTPGQLDRLAAQRYFYSQAKKVHLARMVLALPVPLAWAIAVAIFPSLQAYAALWGVVVSLADVSALVPVHRFWKEQAAKIQELFDCDVLQMPWAELKVGRRPDPETIVDAVKKYRRIDSDYATLKNWYPSAVGQLPLSLARLVCQRSNCWWDATLRRRYATVVAIVIGVLLLLVFALGFLRGLSLEKVILAVLVPLMPTLLWGIREYREQREASDRGDRLKEYVEKLWGNALKGNLSPLQLESESRELQSAIYDHRRSSPVIFDWFYRRLRTGQEEQMNRAAESLVKEIRDKT